MYNNLEQTFADYYVFLGDDTFFSKPPTNRGIQVMGQKKVLNLSYQLCFLTCFGVQPVAA